MAKRGKLLFVTILTVVRFPLVLVFFAGALAHALLQPPASPAHPLFIMAFTAVIASAVTDLFDGYFARRFQVETVFGAHADPLMDKFFSLATLPLLVFVAVRNNNITHAVVLLILTLLLLTRDQWVTFLRSIGSVYQVSGKANWAGKLRTAINFPLICTIYQVEAGPWPLCPMWFLYAFEGLALAVNLISLYVYTQAYLPSLRKSAALKSDTGSAAT